MKRELIFIGSVFLIISSLSNCVRQDDFPVLRGPYLGQKPPGMTPEIFAPEIVSTGMDELNNAFSPGGDEFFFSVRLPAGGGVSMMRMVRRDHRWLPPEYLPFASRFGDIDMSIAPDGSRLFFCSRRPMNEGEDPNEEYDFWMSERIGDSWGTPQHLGLEINSESHDFYPVFTKRGNLYFSSQREGRGTNNIYRSRFVDGRFREAEKLGDVINTEYREFDPYVSPDETFLIFASERPGGFGRADLYISFRQEDGTWAQARNMGDNINSEASDFCPMLTPDGKYLFLTSSRRNLKEFPDHPLDYQDFKKRHNSPQNLFGDIYWVDARVIDRLRQ